MHSFIRIFILALFGLAPISALQAQGTTPATSTSSPKRTDVYHVFFGYAVPGKAAELLEFLKTPDPNASGPSHSIILRHQDGDAWDYVAIEHVGTKATVETGGPTMTPQQRGLGEWHADTYVA